MTEKQRLSATEGETVSAKDGEYVEVEIIGVTTLPLRSLATPHARREAFAREDSEGISSEVKRPTGRGKFAHVSTSSDEFARRKQEEIELEERSR